MKFDLANAVKLSHIQANHELWMLLPVELQQKCDSIVDQYPFSLENCLRQKRGIVPLELLAIFSAVRYFHRLLEDEHFQVLKDHKSLLYTLKSSSNKYSPRKNRLMDFIQLFTSDIRYIKGIDNVPADTF